MSPGPQGRAAELVRMLGLRPHPEGGWYHELFRSATTLPAVGDRGPRSSLTSIDFLLAAGEFSAWHRVQSDEAWHLLEGGPLRLWLVRPELSAPHFVDLAAASDTGAPRHVVPAGWWQAAEPWPANDNAPRAAGFAYVGATVGPGFHFDDFAFGRDDAALRDAVARLAPDLKRLF